MTKDQKEAFDTIRATYQYVSDNDSVLGTYNTERIGILLNLIEEQIFIFESIKEDLHDVREYLLNKPSQEETLDMVQSTLMFLDCKEENDAV